MVEAYRRRNQPQAEYFRQMYALTWNQWQLANMKDPVLLDPIDVLRLPGEKKKRKVKSEPTDTTWDEKAIAIAMEKHSKPSNSWQEQ